ncbi:Serine/threonine protein kinase [Olavius algarvensis associated proteobacterium Delta 3]|nr:Serine/threonine protein kinase [Olavius algarvensis associated proteobacterium Delta 3]
MNKIGKYRIRGLLGRGGMAKVYMVQIPVIDKIAAIKRLDPRETLQALMGENALRDLFIAEARTMAAIRHPNILEVLDYDEAEGRPYFLMEYYADNLGAIMGESYRAESASRVIRADKAFDFCSQTLAGLVRLHDAGIVHRDIKPFNLLVTERGLIKIADFGLSKLRGETFSGPSNLKIGSPYYAPPEQETAPDRVDARADLYAVGVTLYRMLTGRLPEKKLTPPSQINPGLDRGWDAFVRQSLEVHPSDRFTTARAMKKALAEVYADWQARQQEACDLRTDTTAATAPVMPLSDRLRSAPSKTAVALAREMFRVDALGRPAEYIANAFEVRPDGTVFDRTTRLFWEQAGSPYPVNWREADRYVDQLNREHLGGKQDWRLPTVDELTSILTEGLDVCIDPVFDPIQQRLWSCDRRSYTTAWYINVELGFVHWQDVSAPYYVRAVSSE